jgi:hypothetical protein
MGPAWKVPCLIELDRVTSVPETPVVKINQPQEESTRTTSVPHRTASAHAFHCICIIVSELKMDCFRSAVGGFRSSK